MSYTTPYLQEAFEILKKVAIGTFFNTEREGKRIDFQAYSQAEIKALRASLPVISWHKEYVKSLNWWNYQGTWNGWTLRIYGCQEAPRTCKAITERRMVKLKTAIAFTETEEEREVIIGWDCGSNNDTEDTEDTENIKYKATIGS